MKVLYVTNMYPTEETPFEGVFIKEQIEYCSEKYDFEYEIYKIKRKGFKYWYYFKSVFEISFLAKKGKFDLIHVHFGLCGMFLILKRFIKIPVIVTMHGSDIQSFKKRDGLMQKISRMSASKADKVIILNEKMFNLLKRDKDKLVQIPCGVNSSIFTSTRANLNNDNFKLGFPSDKNRIVKNYSLFKSIVKYIRKKGYEIQEVEFSNLTREQLAIQLSQLDCLLMTSLSEGSPQMIKEAMYSGVPVVSTKVGDVEELLYRVKNCYVVDSFEEEILAERVLSIINLSPSDRITNGRCKLIELELDQENVSSKIYKVYCEMVPDLADTHMRNYEYEK